MYHQGGPPPPYGAPWMAAYPPPPGWEGHSPSQGGGVGGPSSHGGHYPPPGATMPPPEPQYPYAQMQGPGDDYARARSGGPAKGPVTMRKESGAEAMRSSISHLVAKEKEYEMRNPVAKKDSLVLEEDKLLLTDYFYHLMKQLRLCRFSEADRKTRGGKREKIKLGYGGLQCIHCADIPNSRKFFWSNVDRLANSFAEIPGHVLKCRRCPLQTKDALGNLKVFHPEQMARLPRGSQKVFFRRMWRRLHDEDEAAGAAMAEQENREAAAERSDAEDESSPRHGTPERSSPDGKGGDDSGEGSFDENPLVVQRSSEEAAKALAEAAESSNPPSTPSSKVLLAIPEDKEWLSDMDCFIRKQLEVFCATEEDVEIARSDRKYPVQLGQVGIRCIHCSLAGGEAKDSGGTAVAYPFAISGIYEAVREFQRLHLDSCDQVPDSVKERIGGFKGASSLSSVLRKYYVLAAKALGLHDTREGIRSGGEHVPVGSQSAFTFAEGPASLGAPQPRSAQEIMRSPKRRATPSPSPDEPDGPPSKKSRSDDESGMESGDEKDNTSSPHKVAKTDESTGKDDSQENPTDTMEVKQDPTESTEGQSAPAADSEEAKEEENATASQDAGEAANEEAGSKDAEDTNAKENAAQEKTEIGESL